MKKLVSLGLATVMALSMAVPAFAADDVTYLGVGLAADEITTADVATGKLGDAIYNEVEISGDTVEAQGASSVVVLNAEPTIFKAVVPIALHVAQDANTDKTYADAMTAENETGTAKIANLSPMGQVVVEDVEVVAESNYELKDWDDTGLVFQNMQVNTKAFAFKINGLDALAETGKLNGFEKDNTNTITSTHEDSDDWNDMEKVFADYSFDRTDDDAAFPMIAFGSVLPIDYEAQLPAFSAAVEDAQVGAVVFTLNFNTAAE